MLPKITTECSLGEVGVFFRKKKNVITVFLVTTGTKSAQVFHLRAFEQCESFASFR